MGFWRGVFLIGGVFFGAQVFATDVNLASPASSKIVHPTKKKAKKSTKKIQSKITTSPPEMDLARPAHTKVVGDENQKEKSPASPPPLREELSALLKKPSLTMAQDPAARPTEWSGSVDYALRTDLADQAKPRLYVHTLGLSYGFTHNPTHISASLGAGLAFESVGDKNSQITVNSRDAELFVSDVDLALAKSMTIVAPYKIALSFDNEFPTSPDARREGYNSVTTLGADLAAAWWEKRVIASVGTSYTYIWNSYRFSPATSDLNKQSGLKGQLGLKLKIWEGLFVSGSIGTQLSTYMDGTTDQTYRNSVGLGYAWSRLTLSAGYSNGTYLNQEDATIWFVDEYRQTASLRMLFNF